MFSELWSIWLSNLVLNLVTFTAAGLWLRRVWPNLQLSLIGFWGLAIILTVYSAVRLPIEVKQAEGLARVRAAAAVKASQPTVAPIENRSAEQLKADFLQTVEATISQPDLITNENRQTLFIQFAKLFPNGESDRAEYARQMIRAYECQRTVFEDALASLKARKVIRSAAQQNCENESGAFFSREKLIPAEMVKANSDLIVQLAKGQSGQGVPDEATLKAAIEGQIRRIDGLRRLFQ